MRGKVKDMKMNGEKGAEGGKERGNERSDWVKRIKCLQWATTGVRLISSALTHSIEHRLKLVCAMKWY